MVPGTIKNHHMKHQCFGPGSGWIRIIWPDPDPLQETLIWIRVAKNKSWWTHIQINQSCKNIYIFFCQRYNDVFLLKLWAYYSRILNKISDFNLGWFVCEFNTIYFLLPGSRSTFPEVDPDPDPAKWYGSNRIWIRIRNTGEG